MQTAFAPVLTDRVSSARVRERSLISWALPAVIVLAAVLQIGGAARQGLWPDEIFSLAMATGHSLEHPAAAAQPEFDDYIEREGPAAARHYQRYLAHGDSSAGIGHVIRAVFLSDTSPPLYYVGLYGWTRVFGTSDWALRGFSIVCSLAALPFLVAIARRISPSGNALLPAVLFACAPLAVYYSGEGRMYGLLWLLVCAHGWTTLRVHESGAPRSSLAWLLTSAAGMLTHYFFVFPWAASVAFLFLQPGADRRWLLGLRLVVVAALLLPWFWHVPESLRQWRVTGSWLEWAPPGYQRLVALRDLVMQFFTGRSPMLWASDRTAEKLALLACTAVAIAALWRVRLRVFSGPRLFVWLWFVAACAGPVVFDLWRGTYTHTYSRYAATALPAVCLLAGGAGAALGRLPRAVWLVLLLISWSPSLANIYRNRARSGSPVREAAQLASRLAGPDGLLVVHSIPSGVLGIARYADPSTPIVAWTGQLGQRQMPASIEQLAAGRERIVFVRLHDVGEPAPQEEWLRMTHAIALEKRLGSISVIEFRSLQLAAATSGGGEGGSDANVSSR